MDANRLKELGLLPLWRLKSGTALDRQPSVPSVESSSIESSLIQQIVPEAQEVILSAASDRDTTIAHADWEQLEQMVSVCTACQLCQTRRKTVFGVGDKQADWLFIGEGPGHARMRWESRLLVKPENCWIACCKRSNLGGIRMFILPIL